MTDNNNYDIYKLYELMDKLTGCAAIFDDEESADCLEDDICEHEDDMDYITFCDDRCSYRQLKDAILRGDKLDVYAALWTPTEEEIKAHKASGGGDDGYLGHAVDTPSSIKNSPLRLLKTSGRPKNSAAKRKILLTKRRKCTIILLEDKIRDGTSRFLSMQNLRTIAIAFLKSSSGALACG